MRSSFRIDQADERLKSQLPPTIWKQLLTLRDCPNLIDGVLLYDEIMAPFYANNFILNKVVPEAWRFQMLVFTLYLADPRNSGDPRGGLTLGKLQAICQAHDLASPGRVFAYLNIMRVGGYLERKPSPDDRRVVDLEPTAKLMDTVETWNDNIFAIIDRIDPTSGLIAARGVNPGLGREMRWHSTLRVIDGYKGMDGFPEVLHFLASDGGWMLLVRIIATMLRQDRTAITPIAINLSAFASEFGVSRSHVRRILERAFQQGLLTAPPANGAHIVPSADLVCSFLAWFASYFANYRACALLAVQ